MTESQGMLGLFLAVSLVSTATPGPAVLYVASQGVAGGMRRAVPGSFGILAADAFYILLSITGLTALLVASYELFVLIKWIGALYLVYLGLRLVRSGLAGETANGQTHPPTAMPRHAFLGGFVLHAGNPKALLYFGSLVPQFVDQSRPLAAQLLTLAAIHLVTASSVLLVYSAVSAGLRRFNITARLRRPFQLATGTFLIGSGIGLLMLRKSSQ